MRTILLLSMLLLIGCDDEESCQEVGPISIRIHNLSAYEIVDFNYDNIQTFNSIMPGETTEYMHVADANDLPWRVDMTVNGRDICRRLIDGFGLNILDDGCYTYLHHVYEFGEDKIISGGKVYNNNELVDLNPMNNFCVELEKSDCNPEPNKANVRLRNSTAFDFCNVIMEINNQENAIFGNLAPGDSTCYISFESLKEYPLQCKFNLADEAFIIENPSLHERLEELEVGFYTYNITIIEPHTKLGDIKLSYD